MNDYKERLAREAIFRNMKRAVYLDIISKAFEKENYEDLDPINKISIIGAINSHSKLSNRIEG